MDIRPSSDVPLMALPHEWTDSRLSESERIKLPSLFSPFPHVHYRIVWAHAASFALHAVIREIQQSVVKIRRPQPENSHSVPIACFDVIKPLQTKGWIAVEK